MTSEDWVIWTDYALALECAVFAGLLLRRGEPLARWGALLFGALAVAAASGAVFHALEISQRASLAPAVWKLTLLAIGACTVACWNLGVALAFRPRHHESVQRGSAFAFVAFGGGVLTGDRGFEWGAIAMALGTLFLLACCVRTPARRGRRSLVAGLVLILAAVAMQQAEVGMSALIDHNTLFHAIALVALGLCFRGVARLSSAGDAPLPRQAET